MTQLGLLPDRIESDDPADRIPDSGFGLPKWPVPIRGSQSGQSVVDLRIEMYRYLGYKL